MIFPDFNLGLKRKRAMQALCSDQFDPFILKLKHEYFLSVLNIVNVKLIKRDRPYSPPGIAQETWSTPSSTSLEAMSTN